MYSNIGLRKLKVNIVCDGDILARVAPVCGGAGSILGVEYAGGTNYAHKAIGVSKPDCAGWGDLFLILILGLNIMVCFALDVSCVPYFIAEEVVESQRITQ
ncbi:hypothetical protein VNO77_42066 [Canavalia gladiata]|uniref:Uncharacterized protein n=1 Tax=Canavalia gladiata TaxID=3824 RepID=A0AAN9K004_CANGL